ncbi:MAG: 4Fe-4S dicluster domain-containing protein [Actinobacteria bacterium]|nr:MAG: 4Fe-4S dicluster domain-containing protein [Actinomycetota bacterium]
MVDTEERVGTGDAPIADPARDVRDDIMDAFGVPEMLDKIWFHKTASAVIDADRCVGCGACIAACPSKSIGVGSDGLPTLVRMCTGCSACWDYCPMAGFRPERLNHQSEEDPVGPIQEAVSARAVERPDGAQDGGAVTALLTTLMERGHIDAVIMTQKLDAFVGSPILATSPEQIRSGAGSVYHQSEALAVLNERAPEHVERIAFVGTPCQISGLRAIQKFPWARRETLAHKVVLATGLFCTRSFDPKKLIPMVAGEGVNLGKVKKIDIREGKLVAAGESGEELMKKPVKDFHTASLKGCDECADFASLGADMVVGNIGSEPGTSTVLIRTDAGMEAWVKAAGAFEDAPIDDLSAVKRLALRNLDRAKKNLQREYDPEGSMWVSYTEHLEDYEGTEREAAPPPPFRSHHYTVAC